MKLLDTTLLSNFAHIEQLDLLAGALPDASTTPQVIAEIRQGAATGRLPSGNWDWLTVVSLSADEQAHFERIRLVLDDGEASCLAVVLVRGGTIFTDDRDARQYAQRLGLPISGTLGVLALLVRGRRLTLAQADRLLQAMIQAGYHSPIKSLGEAYDFGD